MPRIDALLHRRPDLSTFLVHLTAASNEAEANLISIVSSRNIEARNPYGLLRDYANDRRQTNPRLYERQRVVCLTETPLEHVWMMCEHIDDRGHPLAPYGLAFSKAWARAAGANPVWYIDVLRTGHRGKDWLTNALLNLAQQTIHQGGERYREPFDIAEDKEPQEAGLPLESSPIAELAPFIERMGPVGSAGQLRRREFSWEREWRYPGDLTFQWKDVVVTFAPENRHTHVRDAYAPHLREGEDLPSIVDPTWGLERMIGSLAGVADEFAGPLPRY